MSRSVNKVILLGHLGADPDASVTSGGKDLAKFRMATSRTYKDDTGQTIEKTEWHNITSWGNQAKFVGEFLKKGRQVYVEGRLETSKYTDKKTGEDKWYTEVIASDVVAVGSKPTDD